MDASADAWGARLDGPGVRPGFGVGGEAVRASEAANFVDGAEGGGVAGGLDGAAKGIEVEVEAAVKGRGEGAGVELGEVGASAAVVRADGVCG